MEAVIQASISRIARTTDISSARAVHTASTKLVILRKTLTIYTRFRNSLLIIDDVD